MPISEPIRMPRYALVLGALASAVALTCGGCGGGGAENAEGAVRADTAGGGGGGGGSRVVNVEVSEVARGAFTDSIRIAGEVQAYRDVTIAADESGAIVRYRIARGTWVQAGTVIAELDAGVLRAQIEEARATAALAAEQFERQRRLWEEERIGTEIAFLRAKYDDEAARARLATLEARLDRTRIRSPIAGIFDEKFLEEGEYAGIGDPVLRVVSTNPIKVTGGIPERFAANVSRRDSARITFDVFPGRSFAGRIAFVGTSVDPTNRTFPIEIVIRNPDNLIKPRMIANVTVARQRLSDVVVVPQTAVLRSEAGYQVVVAVREGGRDVARARRVTVGPSFANRVVVTTGLEPGERLITLGHQLVDDGGAINVVNVPSPPVASEPTMADAPERVPVEAQP